jgi:hypothetical protein
VPPMPFAQLGRESEVPLSLHGASRSRMLLVEAVPTVRFGQWHY